MSRSLICCLLLLSFAQGIRGESISKDTATVCMSVAPYGEVSISGPLDLEPINESGKGQKHYRAEADLLIEANSDVEISLIASSLSDGKETIVPNVNVNHQSGVVFLPYQKGVVAHPIQMNATWSKGHIQKAGFYQGKVDVLLVANIQDTGCL